MKSTFDVSSTDKLYLKLSKLLKSHDVKVKIFEAYKNRPDELLEAETLICDLERLGCKGLEVKLNDVDNANEFDSIVSELRVAKILLNNKYDAELLSDDDPRFLVKKGKKAKSPDIICIDNAFTTYIEVVKLNANINIINLIQEEIGDCVKFLPYRVDIFLSERLSMPNVIETIDDQQTKLKLNRHEQNELVIKSLMTFKKSFSEIKEKSVLPLNTNITTNDIDFELTKVDLEQGYIGFFLSECADVPPELTEYFEQRCIDKKNKGSEFPILEKNKPFVIAIDSNMREIKDKNVHRLLYGDVVVPCSSTFSSTVDISSKDYKEWVKTYWEEAITEIHNRDSWKKIEKAQSNGWGSFLSEKLLIPNNDTFSYINKDKEGIFTLDKMNDVSAVLLIDHNCKCFFYPNPFCSNEKNNPEIVNFINITEYTEVQNK